VIGAGDEDKGIEGGKEEKSSCSQGPDPHRCAGRGPQHGRLGRPEKAESYHEAGRLTTRCGLYRPEAGENSWGGGGWGRGEGAFTQEGRWGLARQRRKETKDSQLRSGSGQKKRKVKLTGSESHRSGPKPRTKSIKKGEPESTGDEEKTSQGQHKVGMWHLRRKACALKQMRVEKQRHYRMCGVGGKRQAHRNWEG